jgi:hypothetical protein
MRPIISVFVGEAPGRRSQGSFGGVGSSLDSAVAAKAALAKSAHHGKMPLPHFFNSLGPLNPRPLESIYFKNSLDFKSSSKYDPCDTDAGKGFGLLGFPEIYSGVTRSGKGGQGESGGRQEIIRLTKNSFISSLRRN